MAEEFGKIISAHDVELLGRCTGLLIRIQICVIGVNFMAEFGAGCLFYAVRRDGLAFHQSVKIGCVQGEETRRHHCRRHRRPLRPSQYRDLAEELTTDRTNMLMLKLERDFSTRSGNFNDLARMPDLIPADPATSADAVHQPVTRWSGLTRKPLSKAMQ